MRLRCNAFKPDFSQLSDHQKAFNLSGYLANNEEPPLKSPSVSQASKALARVVLSVAAETTAGPILVLPEATREIVHKPGDPLPSTLKYPLETRAKDSRRFQSSAPAPMSLSNLFT